MIGWLKKNLKLVALVAILAVLLWVAFFVPAYEVTPEQRMRERNQAQAIEPSST